MVGLIWLRGLLAHRRGRLAGTAVGVAVSVALIAAIGTFLSATTSRMTGRALARVAVDWQVEGRPGSSARQLLDDVARFPGVQRALPVQIASTSGLRSRTGGSVQATGPGKVLGLPVGYGRAFPGQLRTLAGRGTGVLLFQQTAANLHVRPGDVVTIGGARRRARVRVDGVVDLPAEDSLFQHVGAPPGAQPQAPPDNVIILPAALFARLIGPGTPQVHARLDHRRLPSSPSAAFTAVSGRKLNLETRLAGSGLVGDNLGTALDQARQDALYAELLFLFLGLPGALVAGLLTAAIAAAGADARRRDGALLRTRGASARRLVRVALAETAVAAAAGVAAGLGAALAIGALEFGGAGFGAGTAAAILWAGGAALAGVLVAAGAIALPAWRDARELTVAGQRRVTGRDERAPLWQRRGLDLVCLAGAGIVYWQASRNGYSLVLAPEGVPQISVNWYALLAPVLAWIGAGLLIYRLAGLLLAHGGRFLTRAFRPLAGELAPTVAAALRRERGPVARAVALIALAAAFGASTAVFDSTYAAQAEVDARLTNGADVTVTESPGVGAGPAEAGRLARVPGVASVEPMQHRFAYVGADLQDLYGIRPRSIATAGRLQDAWFSGGSAAGLMATLARQSDAVLVAAETVKDYQLVPGDTLRLRLQDGVTKRFKTVRFRYAGVAKEFPTAPTDSFLVANADYVARQTGTNAIGTFLVQTDGTAPATVAARVRRLLGPSTRVSDIQDSRRVVGSNLTAVELNGLTRVELAFALVLAAGASGLTLALGLQARRRTFALAAALGARPRQLGGFVWNESALVTATGLASGTVLAAAVSWMLVKVLTGVFDPPPDALAIPWIYLLAVAALTAATACAVAALGLQALRRPPIDVLRDL